MLTPCQKHQRYMRVGDIGELPGPGFASPYFAGKWKIIAFKRNGTVLLQSLKNGKVIGVRDVNLDPPDDCTDFSYKHPAYIAPPVCYETGRRKLWEAKHPADGRPGNYYVSAVYGPAMALLLGPFKSHREALDKVPLGRDLAHKHAALDAPWFAYGTVRMADDFTQPGKLNQFA